MSYPGQIFPLADMYSKQSSNREGEKVQRPGGLPALPETRGGDPSLSDPPAGHAAQLWMERLLAAVGSRRGGRKWQCPGHGRTGEHTVALAVGTRTDRTGAWIYCHAGCGARDVLTALGLVPGHLTAPPPVEPTRHVVAHRLPTVFPSPKPTGGGNGPDREARHETYHRYGQRWRKERRRRPDGSKVITWETCDDRGAWVPGLRGAREAALPLYNELDVHGAVALGEVVLVVESESSCDTLSRHGWWVTTWPGGAGSLQLDTIRRVLGGYDHVVVIGDADPAGRRCVDSLHAAGLAPHVLFSDVDGEDARDLYARVGPDQFHRLITNALAIEENR